MNIVRQYAIYDTGVNAYLLPFWSDHPENAKRQFASEVNNVNKNNKIHLYPHQFVLFEMCSFNCQTGEYQVYTAPISLGVGTEFVNEQQQSIAA